MIVDKVQKAYWDKHVSPQLEKFYLEVEPHINSLPEDFEHLEELTSLLEKHLAMLKLLSGKFTALENLQQTLQTEIESMLSTSKGEQE